MSTVYDYRKIIKDTLMSKLYESQLAYWNQRLTTLSEQNAQAYGRDLSIGHYAIYFANRRWLPEHLDWKDQVETAYCLPLHPAFPQFVEEMEVMATEFTELTDERYESDRFLSGLVLFAAPPATYERILGDTLYAACSKEIQEHCGDYQNPEWEQNSEFSIKTFADANKAIVKAMNQRLMINMITRDANLI